MENLKYFLKSKTLLKFLNDLKNKGLKQAYLFSSGDKQKNYYASIILSLLINCKNNLCLNCSNCLKILNGTSVDLFVYPKNKAIIVDDIEEIIESSLVLPLESEYKIYILNNFDEANISSQNKFLKTLEEPPKNVIFLLNSSKPEIILDTIKSRCTKISLPEIKKNELQDIISSFEKNLDITCLENCNNEIGNYFSLVERNFSNTFNFCLNLLKNMKNSSEILEFSSKIIKDRKNLEDYFLSFTSIFNDALIIKYNEEDIFNKSVVNEIKLISENFSEKAINEILKKIIECNKYLLFNTNENLVIDYLLICILEEKFKWN